MVMISNVHVTEAELDKELPFYYLKAARAAKPKKGSEPW